MAGTTDIDAEPMLDGDPRQAVSEASREQVQAAKLAARP